jgi:hypothetical protein
MPCYYPLTGYFSKDLNPSGKRSLVFQERLSYDGAPIKVSCGQCVGCRLERSRQWAVRCLHEAQLYTHNCFITLTYDEVHLPRLPNGVPTLVKRDFQLFMKRLRKRFPDVRIREFHCGEYGDLSARPHFHACLFNFDFPDRRLYRVSDGYRLFTSDVLSELWHHQGFCTVGDVTFESAAYVARYVMKKVTGPAASSHYYAGFDSSTGEVFERLPEFVDMSRRPGIGRSWLEKYASDVYPHDRVFVRGKMARPPKYYDKLFLAAAVAGCPFASRWHDEVMDARVLSFKNFVDDNTVPRLAVREKVALSRASLYQRNLS